MEFHNKCCSILVNHVTMVTQCYIQPMLDVARWGKNYTHKSSNLFVTVRDE